MSDDQSLSSSHVHDAIQTVASSYHTQEEPCPQDQAAENGSSTLPPPTSSSTERTHPLLSNDPVQRESKWSSLLRVQRAIEEESMAKGAENFRKRIRDAEQAGKGSTVGAAKRLLTHGIIPTEAAISYYLTEARLKRGAKSLALRWLDKLSEYYIVMEDEALEKPYHVTDQRGKIVGRYKTEDDALSRKHAEEAQRSGVGAAAYMAIRAILDAIGRKPYVKEVALNISEMILDELRYARFCREAPGLFKYKLDSFNTSSYVHMARSLNAAMRYAKIDVSDLDLSTRDRIILGTKLLEIVQQATGLIEVELNTKSISRRKKGGVKRELLVRATPETQAFLEKRNSIIEFLSPVLMPMVVPPLQWEPGHRGGYRFALRNKMRFVRSNQLHSQSSVMNDEREMPLVYATVNALQNTPWKINQAVLSLIETLWDTSLSLAGIVTPALEDEPAKPHDIDTNEVARKDWRRRAHAVKERNVVQRNRANEIDRVLTTAKRMKDYEAIFFPHNLDFRGRIYPISHFLTPQGDDLQKGLLTFATGKPLGESGASYLALHGMNVLDVTPEGQKVKKMTLDERISWVEDHSADICAVANDPLGYKWWADAGEPIQFYAFCLEWNNYLKLAKEGRGHEYVCSLPVSIDGSCNGLQHFAAMLRDPVSAKAVNVFPNERPEDVYDRIAEASKDKLEIGATTDDERALSALWLSSGLVNRDLAKRPTMTFSYGSKPYGFQQQLVEYLKEPKRWPKVKHFFTREVEGVKKDVLQAACALMSRMIWLSLQDVVVAAFRGMEWMQKVARSISHTGKPIEWTVPITGFRVRQEYFVLEEKRVETILAGRARVQLSYHERKPEIQMHKQSNAVSPNVIHSLDAAGLMLAVTDAQAEGVEQFSAVHDSYGCLAADMPILWRTARQSFVRLYITHNVIEDLAQQFQGQAREGEVIPAPPERSTLDVASVLASDYFFC